MHADEANALAALQAGHPEGLHVLVDRYQLPALRLAYGLCHNTQVAEDAVADSFLGVLKHARSYDPSRPFQAWFFRIVVNSVRAVQRREGRQRMIPEGHDQLRDRPAPHPGPESMAIRHEVEQALLAQVDRLPVKQREVVVLRYYLDMDERTMSAVLDVPVGTVKWRLHQARKTLRHRLEARTEPPLHLVEEVKEP